MEITVDEIKKIMEISGMIGCKEGIDMCFKSIKSVHEKMPNADINVLIEVLEKTIAETLKETGTDVTYDDIKFLHRFINV